MKYKMFNHFAMFVVSLAVAWPVEAGLPQYGAVAANTNDTDPITENWNCSTAVGSVTPPSRCYSGDLLPSGFRIQGNGTPYGDSQAVADVHAAIGWPAPAGNDPVNGSFILWLGDAGYGNGGPGTAYTVDSTGPGDNFVIWRTPNTHDGRRAQSGTTTLMNDMVRPAGIHRATVGGGMQFVPEEPGKKAFYVPGGFQYDTAQGKWLIMSEATYPYGNHAATDTTIYIGESLNGVNNYTWRPIVNFRFKPTDPTGPAHYGVRWTPQGRSLVKDPFNSSRWIGVTGWSINESGLVTGRGTAPAMIDFSQSTNPAIGIQYCVGFENGLDMSDPKARQGFTNDYDFYCYREADKDLAVKTRPLLISGAEALPAVMFGNFGTIALVNNSGGFHGEIWTTSPDESPLWCAVPSNRALPGYGYSTEDECALARHWCVGFLNSDQYLANRTAGANTNRLIYREWSPTTLWLVNDKSIKKELENDLFGLGDSTLGWPSPQGDHVNSYWAVSRFDWPQETALGKNLMYVSRKRSICFEPLQWGNIKYGGLGSSVLNLEEH